VVISVVSMNVLDFAGEVVLLSASGVLSPGPLFLMNLVYGAKQGYKAGLKIASGHAMIELPLIIILAISFFQLTNTTVITYNLNALGLVGGTSIIIFGIIQIINTTRNKRNKSLFDNSNNNYRVSFIADKPILLGIIFSALNPFFIAWWLTVGLTLISDSISLFGVVTGSVLLFSFHIWMDYIWLILTSYLISKGVSVIKTRYYYFLFMGLNIILTFYGMHMIVSGISFIL
jgi:threonine/homoserine/homoserine lactone efflux protein